MPSDINALSFVKNERKKWLFLLFLATEYYIIGKPLLNENFNHIDHIKMPYLHVITSWFVCLYKSHSTLRKQYGVLNL